MDTYSLAQLVIEMREAQRKYFRMQGVNPEIKAEQLGKSKTLEKKVDSVCDKIINPTIF